MHFFKHSILKKKRQFSKILEPLIDEGFVDSSMDFSKEEGHVFYRLTKAHVHWPSIWLKTFFKSQRGCFQGAFYEIRAEIYRYFYSQTRY